jgi:hypothetical protein
MKMHKVYQAIVRKLVRRERRSVDPVIRFTPREWADLPPHHPRTERD